MHPSVTSSLELHIPTWQSDHTHHILSCISAHVRLLNHGTTAVGDDTADYGDNIHSFSTRDRLRSPSEASTSYLSDDIDRVQQTRNASSVLWGLFQRGHDVEGAVSLLLHAHSLTAWWPWQTADISNPVQHASLALHVIV